jgi:hypothetical protein
MARVSECMRLTPVEVRQRRKLRVVVTVSTAVDATLSRSYLAGVKSHPVDGLPKLRFPFTLFSCWLNPLECPE